MSEKEIEIAVRSIRKNGKLIAKAKRKSFLKKIGILNKSGKVTNAYKEICIPIEQD
ncbi:MAG TPA: hypothetical protein VIM16_18295 [Mucilaginibacter sp.]|jgi:CRISPR/Cas system-associated endonuclease Cas3-HD